MSMICVLLADEETPMIEVINSAEEAELGDACEEELMAGLADTNDLVLKAENCEPGRACSCNRSCRRSNRIAIIA